MIVNQSNQQFQINQDILMLKLIFSQIKISYDDYFHFFLINCFGMCMKTIGQVAPLLTQFMEQKEAEIDCLTAIREDLSSLPFVRHYMQEQSSVMPKKEESCDLPFNHLINLVVSQLSITNRQIAANSKLNTGLLDNGKQIAQKKHYIFQAFIKEYPEIQEALELMHPSLKPVFQHSVMALSNLILKLSINMAKISIVVITKLLTPPSLDIFTTSLLFEKYIQIFSTSNKKHIIMEQARQHLKQFPRVAYIKISKKRNPYDFKFIKQQQRQLNKTWTSDNSCINIQPPVYNVHFFDFFEEDPLYTPSKQLTLPFYQGFNLSNSFGIKQPFGFQLFLLIKQLAVNRLQEFRPDLIVYVENFDSSQVGIDPRIEGLILNQLSEKVQAKIYVFKEFGITEEIKKSWLKSQNIEQIPFNYDFMLKDSSKRSICSTLPQSEIPNQPYSGSHIFKDFGSHLKNYMKQNQSICVQLFQLLQNQIKSYYISNVYPCVKQMQIKRSKMPQLLKKIKYEYSKILQQQLLYMSLALIQKTNFEQISNQYSNYIFSQQFLKKTINFLRDILSFQPNSFSEYKQFLNYKIQKISCMLSVSAQSKYINNQTLPFYNILTKKKEKFLLWDGRQYQISFNKNDTFFVAYAKENIILCIFRQQQYAIYLKHMNDKCFKFVKMQKRYDKAQLFNKNSTFVNNNQYIYKAFGEPNIDNPQLNSAIYRFNIQKLENLKTNTWQLVQTQCLSLIGEKIIGAKGIKIPLQHKIHGFGYSYYLNEKDSKDNVTLFGGGYNYKLQNQERINKYLYIIKGNQKRIYKIGKTNGELINQNQNMRNKYVLYPFIYGIPVALQQNQLLILNTNGYQQNVNHSKKLFLTKIKVKPIDNINSTIALNGIGIVTQNKLYYGAEPQVEIANKNTIMKYALSSYNRINRHKNCVALYNHRNQVVVMEVGGNINDKLDCIRISPLEETNLGQGILNISFSNKKMVQKVPI